MNNTLNKNNKSWIDSANGSFFPIQNLPLGIYSIQEDKRVCTRIGDYVLDLYELYEKNLLPDLNLSEKHLKNDFLNDLISLGKEFNNKLRTRLTHLLGEGNSVDRTNVENCLHKINDCRLHLPVRIGDYTDFYSSREHATNVGIMFRDPANALLPNWLHMPVGYHGRASSIVVSGTEIKRPSGQIVTKDGEPPIFSQSRQLDFELEMAFVIGKGNELGTPISIEKTHDHIFGLCLFNDWSARDIQKWEYVPLGPFLGKNFASTTSPWIVSLEALAEFKVYGPIQHPQPLDYLNPESQRNLDIILEVYINDTLVCTSNTKYLYWSMSQQLAHHTINGCNMQVGDFCASGTISGPDSSSFGSMLELAWKGTKPITLSDGTSRTFIQDGDVVRMNAYAQNENYKIGFGECEGKVL
ncbi:MAG: fumarylacetoacetase [Saprospiraceae bacterium]